MPGGLPTRIPYSLPDPRQYGTDSAGSYDSSFSTITKPGSSPYARAIATTPGLVHWWRMGAFQTMVFQSNTAVILPSAGAACLKPSGTVTLVPGLIPGDRDKACYLNSAYMHCDDYFLNNGNHEVFTMECWVKLVSIPSNFASALMGEWAATNGNMLYVETNDSGATSAVKMFHTGSNVSASAALVAGKTYHIVGCFGGTDHVSRLYINGVQAASGNLTNGAAAGNSWASTVQFEVGQYANHAGTTSLNGVIDEIAIYSRMLQPLEVKQHYNAAFARA